MPDYTSLILNPLMDGLRVSVNEIFSMMVGVLPIVLPVVGALALIYLGIGLFSKIVHESISERENMAFIDSYTDYDYEDMMSDYFLFADGEVDYTVDDELGEWIDLDYGE